MGSIVQVPLADVNCSKVDQKNLTLIVVEVVHQKGAGTSMYWLASQAGVLSRLCHPSYITSVAANPEMLCLQNVLDEWTGPPKISEREASRVVSLDGGKLQVQLVC